MSDTLTVSEAATVAGVSVRTMRRWATSGQVRTVGSGHGRRVVADSISKAAAKEDTNGHDFRTESVQKSDTTVTQTASGHEADRLAALVADLAAKLADQTALTAIWQERARVLGDQLALAAPADSPVAAQPGPEAVPLAPTSTPPGWRRLWPLLAFLTVLAVLAVLVAVGLVTLLR